MTAYEFVGEVWRHTGEAAWYFVTVPADVSDDIEARTVDDRRGFGSVRVEVTVGSTRWHTSVFPDNTRAAYVLPVKKAVRAAEELDDGATVQVHLDLVDE